MPELSAYQRTLVANVRARKQEKAISQQLKEQAEANRKLQLAEKRSKTSQNQHAIENKLTLRYMKRDVARFAMTHNDVSKRHDKKEVTRAKTVPIHNSNKDIGNVSVIDPDEEIRRPPRYRPPNAWAKLYELEEQQVKEDKLKKHGEQIAMTQLARTKLKEQQEEKMQLRQQEREIEMLYHRNQEAELAKYKERLREAECAKEEKQQQTKAEFNQMVAQAKQLRETQKKAKMQSELRDVERAKAALEAEQHRLEEEKRKKAIQVEQVKAENRKIQEAKRDEKLREQEYDKKLAHDYQQRLAAQELARKEQIQRTYERQEKRVNMALLNVISPEERARQDEAKAALIQASERAKEDARLEEKRKRQMQLDRVQGNELKKQQEDKRRRQAAEREQAARDDAIEAQDARDDAIEAQDALAAEIAARAKQAKKDAIDREYRAKLAKQMKEEKYHKATDDKWSMSQLEMQLNSTMLRKAGVQLHTK